MRFIVLQLRRPHAPFCHQRPLGLSELEKTVKKAPAIAALVVGFSIACSSAFAQGYVVNGRNASKSEVQLLVSHGAQPGKWLVDGYGISAADSGAKMPQPTAGNSGRKCWYVLDVLLCE